MDFEYDADRRKYQRFSSRVFQGVDVVISPMPPFFGDTLRGYLVDLSAGGMAFNLPELIPKKNNLIIHAVFPDKTEINTTGRISRSVKKKDGCLIGLEFFDLPDFIKTKIERMTVDYLDCEKRILYQKEEICRLDCAFFSLCKKPYKETTTRELNQTIRLDIK